MKLLLLRIFAILALCGPVQAQDFLPVALNHKSVPFPVDGHLPPLLQGARVSFTVEDENGVPRPLRRTSGLVLGSSGGIVFIELPDASAIEVARYQAEGSVNLRKISDPDPEVVAVRKGYRNSGNMILLAPQMRRMTVTLSAEAETVDGWRPGETLTFFDAREVIRRNWNDREQNATATYKAYQDITAMFRFAEETADGRYDITIVADPYDVDHLLKAELEGRLKVEESDETLMLGASRDRCEIVNRRGVERVRIEIPCSD